MNPLRFYTRFLHPAFYTPLFAPHLAQFRRFALNNLMRSTDCKPLMPQGFYADQTLFTKNQITNADTL
jgi:hypothetical protein